MYVCHITKCQNTACKLTINYNILTLVNITTLYSIIVNVYDILEQQLVPNPLYDVLHNILYTITRKG